MGVHLLDVAREPRDVHAACGELIGGESVVGYARAVDDSDGAGSELMRDGFEERGLAVSRGCEEQGDLAGTEGAGDVLEHLEVLDCFAGVGVGCGAEGACGGFDGRERGGGEHLGDGDDVAVDFAGGQLEGVAQVALDLNLGELAVLLRLAFEDRDVVAQLVAGVASHLALASDPLHYN